MFRELLVFLKRRDWYLGVLDAHQQRSRPAPCQIFCGGLFKKKAMTLHGGGDIGAGVRVKAGVALLYFTHNAHTLQWTTQQINVSVYLLLVYAIAVFRIDPCIHRQRYTRLRDGMFHSAG